MESKGFTLIELLTTITVIAITLSLGMPQFAQIIQNMRTQTAAHTLLQNINSARTAAVFNSERSMLLAHPEGWHKGWKLFIDSNNNGILDDAETLVRESTPLNAVVVRTNTPLREYVSFISSGEGRKPGRANGGAALMGTMEICPEQQGPGYALVLSRGGRTRIEQLNAAECADNRIGKT